MKYMPYDQSAARHIGYQQQVKEANIKQIFDLVRGGKCKSRAEIVRAMKLSATSVSVLVEELAARGLIQETGPAQTTIPGRRPITLRLNRSAGQLPIFAVSSKGIRFTLLDLDFQRLEDRFFPLDPPTVDADAFTQLIEEILYRHSTRFDAALAIMIGITFPGFYLEQDHLFHTTPALGFPLPEASLYRLQARVELPIFLMNNTRSMAYAEKKYLDSLAPDEPNPTETENMLFVRIGDGIRSGIISGGELYLGPYNISGEIGHFSIDYQGRPCPCGNRGCLKQYANLSAILKDARQAAEERGLTPPESFEALARSYADAPALLDSVRRSARMLAFGLYGLMCSTGIRHIVLGGQVEALGAPFLREVEGVLRERNLLARNLSLSYAQAGPNAEVTGIAQYFLDKVFTVTT